MVKHELEKMCETLDELTESRGAYFRLTEIQDEDPWKKKIEKIKKLLDQSNNEDAVYEYKLLLCEYFKGMGMLEKSDWFYVTRRKNK